jgi:hypothetical protein
MLKDTWPEGSTNNPALPVGGLDATASDLKSSMRNSIKKYVELSKGGQWVESSSYNLGTLRLVLSGAEGVRTATGVDHFPEITALQKELALSQIYEMAPDHKQAYQWGDVEHTRELELFHRSTLLGQLAGLNQNDPKVGPYIKQFTDEFMNKHGLGYKTAGAPHTYEPGVQFSSSTIPTLQGLIGVLCQKVQ